MAELGWDRAGSARHGCDASASDSALRLRMAGGRALRSRQRLRLPLPLTRMQHIIQTFTIRIESSPSDSAPQNRSRTTKTNTHDIRYQQWPSGREASLVEVSSSAPEHRDTELVHFILSETLELHCYLGSLLTEDKLGGLLRRVDVLAVHFQ